MTPFEPIRLQNIIPESMEIWVTGRWETVELKRCLADRDEIIHYPLSRLE